MELAAANNAGRGEGDMNKEMDRWEMPEWMEKYREHIGNTGGNSVEDLLDRLANEKSLMKTNWPVAVLAIAVESQVDLLKRLHRAGLLEAK